MANRVKLSTFACRPPQLPVDTPPADVAQAMIDFWKDKLDSVLPDRPDLILLPEMCDRPQGWTSDGTAAYFEARENRLFDFFRSVAAKNRCYVAYSSALRASDGRFRNATAVLDREGSEAGRYHKNHCTIGENEDSGMVYGKESPRIECDFGAVSCAICFDLNFEEIRQKTRANRPDVVLFSSMYHGGLMQPYWAYSCRAHFVASVCGLPSAILAPTGETLATTTNYTDHATATVNLDCGLFHLDYNRPLLAELKRKYGPRVTVHDPGFLGAVLVSSEAAEFSVADLVSEFGLEPLDDYFERALAHRRAPGRVEP